MGRNAPPFFSWAIVFARSVYYAGYLHCYPSLWQPFDEIDGVLGDKKLDLQAKLSQDLCD
jgi:hypothetical protein